jgi:hypothetical protein
MGIDTEDYLRGVAFAQNLDGRAGWEFEPVRESSFILYFDHHLESNLVFCNSGIVVFNQRWEPGENISDLPV